uniref:Uncharacterized protein n=1 Tax=Faecalibaculum rodentium TaxID=1702221 RepID=A0A140DYA5_9FIRM|nr:hypothetical protein AALO17_24980 [Faecalibaculum rodentium]
MLRTFTYRKIRLQPKSSDDPSHFRIEFSVHEVSSCLYIRQPPWFLLKFLKKEGTRNRKKNP